MNDITKEIFDYISNNYGILPEYLWAKFPDYCVFRHKGSGKWFAVYMPVEKSKIGLDGSGKIPLLVIKHAPEPLLGQKGIVPAYHMSKKNWVSILLDGTVDAAFAEFITDEAYSLLSKKH